ncbi:cation-translocating P-type ATPase [Pedobacter flavus]|uniref:Cation-translocating P-type ATPase n=1 Tax=Pedobacter flavus TaxID=3113906 RepID=A0ABU7H411_9SPHI|nr:cation-translocating P-type ATPase [Pedobacter sp. VNH31]MEE1885331.1 cation-translocating P-type ATPase [Pedobacter sp. VNH31]
MNYNIPSHLIGLSEEELAQSRSQFGYNEVEKSKSAKWYQMLLDILKEPMLILLIAVSIIYLIVGNYSEALFMLGAIIAVSAISFYQDNRSKKALEALEKLNEPLSLVIRNKQVLSIPTHEIAVGDLSIIEEGKMINADGKIVHSNDFSVIEASLTGESYSIFKSKDTEDRNVYSGTLVASGLAVFEVEKIGANTKIGAIGKSIKDIEAEISPLQIQITKFVKGMAVIGVVVFLMVWVFSYFQTGSIINSLLAGLTLAMSVLPEEIPVAFTTFMALGAWKLMREGVIIKRSNVVETLGSTTVICTDKTGTITENSMHLKQLYDFKSDKIYDDKDFNEPILNEIISYSMWSSEPVPFDPMEKTIHKVYEETQTVDLRPQFKLFHEYPLEGKPPMMTHVFKNENGELIIAAKGAPEAIISVSNLSDNQLLTLRTQFKTLGQQGFRVLGVAKSIFTGEQFPEKQQDLEFEFLGFTIFYDPPKKGINDVFQKIYHAGIKVKVITGDNADTTHAIAAQAGIINEAPAVNGTEIMACGKEELVVLSNKTSLFTRMFPEAKLEVVKALKQNGEIVAMLGDGVNDAPALKSAHIGVAMGNKGTEIAKAAASLVITNDDLDKLIIGIEAGRRIYANLKKAIQYIISIHIPIILTVSIPLFLDWIFPNIFTPVHVIFLELVMGPTCSIVYENEPMEKNTMLLKPRKLTDTFLNWKELSISIIQGLVITIGVLFAYQFTVNNGGDEEKTRAVVFTTLIFSNILLSYVNRSFYYSIFETFMNKNSLLFGVTTAVLVFLMIILYVPAVSEFFKLSALNFNELIFAGVVSIVSVGWFEIYKFLKRQKS